MANNRRNIITLITWVFNLRAYSVWVGLNILAHCLELIDICKKVKFRTSFIIMKKVASKQLRSRESHLGHHGMKKPSGWQKTGKNPGASERYPLQGLVAEVMVYFFSVLKSLDKVCVTLRRHQQTFSQFGWSSLVAVRGMDEFHILERCRCKR